MAKVTERDNNFSISSKDIVLSLQKSVGAAQTFGVSLEQLIGMSVAIGETSRESGNIIGNSLKTIFSRVTTMGESVRALQSVGVATKEIVDGVENVRPVADILDDLGKRWVTLNAEQQQSIGLQIAGRFQLSRFLILMQNYSRAVDATNTALNSQGSGIRENEQYLQSLEARLNRVKNAGTELSLAMGDAFLTDSIIVFAENVASLASNFSKLTNSVGVFAPVLGAVGFATAILSKNFSTLIVSVFTLGRGLTALGVSASAASIALKRLWSSTGIGLAFVALGIAIEKLISKWADHSTAVRENREEQEKGVKSLRNHSGEIERKIGEYTTLSEKVSLNTVETEKLREVQNDLNRMLPSLTQYIDDQGNAHLRNAESIQIEIDRLKELQKFEDKRRLEDRDENRGNILSDIKKEENELKRLENSRIYYENRVGVTGSSADQAKLSEIIFDIEDQNYKIQQTYQQLSDDIYENVEANLRLKGSYDGLTDADRKYVRELANKSAQVTKSIEDIDEQGESHKKASEAIEEQSSSLASLRKQLGSSGSALSSSEILDLNYKQAIALASVNEKTKEGTVDWVAFRKELEASGIPIETINKITNSLSLELLRLSLAAESSEDGLEGASAETEEFSKMQEEARKKVSEAKDEIKTLNQTLHSLNEGQSLSAEEMDSLILKFPSLIDKIHETADGYVVEKDALEVLREIRLESLKESMKAEQGLSDVVFEEIKSRVANYIEEVDAIKTAAEARNAAYKLRAEANPHGDIYGAYLDDEQSRAVASVEELANFYKKMEGIEKNLSIVRNNRYGVSSSSSKSSGSSGGKSAEEVRLDNLKEQYDTAVRNNEHIVKMQNLNANDQLYLWNMLAKNHEEYLSKNTEASQRHIEKQLDLENQKATERYNNSKEFIETEKYFNRMTLEDELAGYERMLEEHKDHSDRKLAIDKEMYRIRKEMLKRDTDDQTEAYEKWKKNAEDVADTIVKTLKEAIEKQRDTALDSIDKQIEKEEKRHQDRMDNLDDELKKYQDTVDEIMKTMDRESAEEDYNKELTKLQQKELDTRELINKLALNDSLEAQARKSDLEKELGEIVEDIEELKNKRTKDLRKQNLNDLMDAKRDEIQSERDADKRISDSTKERLKNERESQKEYWDNILKDEERFLNIRNALVEGNLTKFNSLMSNFKSDMQSYMEQIGRSMDTHVISKLNTINDMVGGINADSSSSHSSILTQMQANSAEWHNASATRRQELERSNQVYGAAIGATMNPITYRWEKNGVPIYHDGGVVGGKYASPIAEKLHKLLNLKSNEQLSILKHGELVVKNPANIASSLLRQIKMPNINLPTPAVSGGAPYYNIIMNQRVNGDESGGRAAFGGFMKELRKIGK